MIHHEYVTNSLKSIEQLAQDLADKYEQQILELQAAMQRLREKVEDRNTIIDEQKEEIKSLRLVLSWMMEKGIDWRKYTNELMIDYLDWCEENQNESI